MQSVARRPFLLTMELLAALPFLLLLLLPLCAHAVHIEVQVVDTLGTLIPARPHVRDSNDDPYPGHPDPILMSHCCMGSYFYTSGMFEMDLPAGVMEITVGRGFEWRPVHLTPNIQQDTLLVVTLERPFNMRELGWYGGDPHVDTRHEPSEYDIGPEKIHLIALCEDLAQVCCLDQDYEFTGDDHWISTPEASIYYTVEYRNMSMGHVGLQGLKELGQGPWCCCWYPLPVYPLLCHTREEWNPQWGEAMIVVHPHNGAGFFEEQGWPGTGLARELPVLAALGHLDALDITAFTNNPDVYFEDWYRLLNCGLQVPASSGSDALTNWYEAWPAGGYRVYVKEQPGDEHDYGCWVEGLKAGRCFVTNYPLVPHFAVDGVETGGVLDVPGPVADVDVSFSIRCVLPLQSALVIRNGEVIADIHLPADFDGTVADTTIRVHLDESAWLALRVEGETTLPHAVNPLFAHTGAVYVRMDEMPVRQTGDAGYMLDWIDSLEIFVEARGNWDSEEDHQHVLQTLADAGAVYGELFEIPPSPFDLLTPAEGDTLPVDEPIFFDWSDAWDPEEGDRVAYRLQVSADSSFAFGWFTPPLFQSEYLFDLPLTPHEIYWWRVIAQDRGGNTTLSTPEKRYFIAGSDPAGIAPDGRKDGWHIPEKEPGKEAHALRAGRLLLWPNPSSGRVWLQIPAAYGTQAAKALRIEILDVRGRRVAGGGTNLSREMGIRHESPGLFVWNARDCKGHPVPSGCYWVRIVPHAGDPADSEPARQSIASPVLILR